MEKEGKSSADVDAFKKKIQAWVMSLLNKDRFKNLAFFIGIPNNKSHIYFFFSNSLITGENMAEGKGEGQVAIVEYRQENGEEVPTLMLVKEALVIEKC